MSIWSRWWIIFGILNNECAPKGWRSVSASGRAGLHGMQVAAKRFKRASLARHLRFMQQQTDELRAH